MPLGEACDQVVELDDVWGPEGGLLRERLCEAATPAAKFRVLEAVLIEHIARSADPAVAYRSEENTSELQSRLHLVCRLLLEKKNRNDAGRCPPHRPSPPLSFRGVFPNIPYPCRASILPPTSRALASRHAFDRLHDACGAAST